MIEGLEIWSSALPIGTLLGPVFVCLEEGLAQNSVPLYLAQDRTDDKCRIRATEKARKDWHTDPLRPIYSAKAMDHKGQR